MLMEHLFTYTKELSSKILSLIEDLAIYKRILTENPKSELTVEKMVNTEKELRMKLYFLRVLEHISYLETYKADIIRIIESIENFLDKKTYSSDQVKKITYFLSSLKTFYVEEEEAGSLIAHNKSSTSIAKQTVYKLEDTMRVIEEILLSFYGFAAPLDDLEEKLIKSVEALFALKLEDLKMEEKLKIEEFFNHIQQAFQGKTVEGWEIAFVECTNIINTLKTLAGMDPDSKLSINIESGDEEIEEQIIFEPWSEEEEKEEGDEEEEE
jgi:hypothetical protein